MGEALADTGEVLFRQVHPQWLEDDGEPSSQPFKPFEKDKNMLSVDRSSLTDAAQSHALFVGNGFESVAVYGVSVGEFSKEKLPCAADPLPQTDKLTANPAHALADYSGHAPKDHRNIAKRLKLVARARGVLFRP